MRNRKIADGLFVLDGAVNTGALVAGGRALLFDCCDSVTSGRLSEIGASGVDMVLCTQHRRPNTAGARFFVERGAEPVVPASEKYLFDDPGLFWNDPANRWHIYHHQPGPEAPSEALTGAPGVSEGDLIEWMGHTVRVLDTPGATCGSVSYLVEAGGRKICFSGDVIFGPGWLWNLYSLQKGGCFRDSSGAEKTLRDYHAFMGNRAALVESLRKLAGCGAETLVPSHGALIHDPKASAELLIERLSRAWQNYTSISSLHHYFPGLFDEAGAGGESVISAKKHEFPPFIRHIGGTTSAIMSQSGAAFLVDCGDAHIVDVLRRELASGSMTSLDGCWVTHYHDDHTDGLGELHRTTGCPIITAIEMAEIIEHSSRFFLPCISPVRAPVARKTRNGESWRWREFKLTAFHFPGQSLYHGGLLVEGRGLRVFFAGDSGSPSGLDDYCCGNRNFLGKGKGFRGCLELWRALKPDMIINQHQAEAFSFTDSELDRMDKVLAEREVIFSELLPWPHPNFGTDENWVRSYPYEQDARGGNELSVELHFTNHGAEAVRACVEAVLPAGWGDEGGGCAASVIVPAGTCGFIGEWCAKPDSALKLSLRVPPAAAPGRYLIPFRVTWGDMYLGQIRHALVNIL